MSLPPEKVYHNGETVEIPSSGPENRRQAAALVGRAVVRVRDVDWKMGRFGSQEGVHLDDDETALLTKTLGDLRKLEDKLKRSALERLAAAAPPDEAVDPVKEIFDTYGNELSRWIRRDDVGEHHILRLAFLLLESAGVDEGDVVDIKSWMASAGGLSKRYKPVTQIYVCPWCDGDGYINAKLPPEQQTKWTTTRKVKCSRCAQPTDGGTYSDGYIYGGEDPEETWLSKEGRAALSEGRPWTIEDEVREEGYESIEDALGDSWEIPPELEKADGDPQGPEAQ